MSRPGLQSHAPVTATNRISGPRYIAGMLRGYGVTHVFFVPQMLLETLKCALPETPVVCFAGDGGFYYHLAELETAARYGINAVVIVNNNGALNQEIPHFDRAYGGDPDERGREMWGFSPVDFSKVAASLGCLGIRVERPAEVAPALERALAAGRPAVIDVVTDHRAFAPRTWTGAETAPGH